MTVNVANIHTLLPELGDDVYGTIVPEIPKASEWLCAPNKEWGKDGQKYTGIASRWMPEWDSTLQPTQHTLQHDGNTVTIHAMFVGTERWSRYYQGDVFLSKKVTSEGVIQKYLGMDDFGTMVLVGSAAKECLERYNIKGRVDTPLAYSICGRFGIWATRPAEPLTAISADSNIIKTVLRDVHATLSCLRDHSYFHHGNLVMSSVLWTGTHTRITDFVRSSILIPGNVKVFNESRVVEVSHVDPIHTSEHTTCVNVSVGTSRVSSGTLWCSKRTWWKLGLDFDVGRDLILSHSGIPYYTVIDWYVFILSLMMHPTWHSLILGDVRTKNVWTSMWLPDEYMRVTHDCSQFGELNRSSSIRDVYVILKRYHMCADCMTMMGKSLL